MALIEVGELHENVNLGGWFGTTTISSTFSTLAIEPIPHLGMVWRDHHELATIKLVNSVDSWRHCSDLCRQTDGCKLWNYTPSSSKDEDEFKRRCTLLRSATHLKVMSGRVGGTILHGIPGEFHILSIAL